MGYGIQLGCSAVFDSDGFESYESGLNHKGTIYYCRRSEAEKRGWIDPLPKPKFKGTLAECARYCEIRNIDGNFKCKHNSAWIDMHGDVYLDSTALTNEALTEPYWEEVSNE